MKKFVVVAHDNYADNVRNHEVLELADESLLSMVLDDYKEKVAGVFDNIEDCKEYLKIHENEVFLDFTNKVDEKEEVIDDGEINAILYLTDNDYKEIYNRGDFEEKTGMSFEEYKNSDLEMNVYAVSDKAEDDNAIKLYATVKDEATYEDGYIPISPKELETLVDDIDRAIDARYEQENLKENTDVEYDN